MPKRTSRQRQEADVDVMDDEFAWESPKTTKKKKKKKKKRTSAAPAAEEPEERPRKKKKSTKSKTASTSAKRRSSKAATPSTRSKRSGSARRSSADGEGLATSGRRRGPAPKKKNDNTVMIVSAVSVALLLVFGLIFIMNRGPAEEPRNEETMMQSALDHKNAGMKAFQEWNAARRGNDVALEKAKHKEALDHLQAAIDGINSVLDEHRDAEGFTLPEYEGYEKDLSEISQLIIDLEKSGRTH